MDMQTQFHFSRVAAPPVEREYLNGNAVSQRLGISLATLHRWRYGHVVKEKDGHVAKRVPPLQGFPTPYHFGPDSAPLWKLSELEAFEQSRKEPAKDPCDILAWH